MQGLTKSYSDQYGNTYAQAYFVIGAMGTDYEKQRCHMVVHIYGSQAAMTGGFRPVASYEYDIRQAVYNRDGDGAQIAAFTTIFPPANQAGYGIDITATKNWLLTLPELAGAV